MHVHAFVMDQVSSQPSAGNKVIIRTPITMLITCRNEDLISIEKSASRSFASSKKEAEVLRTYSSVVDS